MIEDGLNSLNSAIVSDNSNSQVPKSMAVLKSGTLKDIPEKGPVKILPLERNLMQNLKKE